MSVAAIVPIALGLPSGDVVTLWAPAWREDGEDWEAMLGLGDNLYGFDTPAELAAFIRSGAPHDLEDHPSWDHTRSAPAIEFDPDEDHSYDLVGVPELLVEDPTEESVLELDDCFTMVRTIASICELKPISKLFAKHGILSMTAGGIDNFYGREGQRDWNRLGKIIAKHWDEVLSILDSLLVTPVVDEASIAQAAAELDEARALMADESPDATHGLLDEEDWEADPDEDPFWASIGIDPVKFILPSGTRFTLRCYINDKPLFLGKDEEIFGFTSQRSLLRFIADEPDHTMFRLPGWDQVVFRAGASELNVRPTDDNIYSFARLPKHIEQGPAAVDETQLELAVEALADAEDCVGGTAVADALSEDTRLGSFVDAIIADGDLPEAPYADIAESWTELVEWLDDHITVVKTS